METEAGPLPEAVVVPDGRLPRAEVASRPRLAETGPRREDGVVREEVDTHGRPSEALLLDVLASHREETEVLRATEPRLEGAARLLRRRP